ncbi:MAG: DUF2625 family protein [Planctomycetota bacterium]
MRTLEQLINRDDPAMPKIRDWFAQGCQQFDVLEPSSMSGEVLVGLQVTTRSPMGAIAYETGGILIANGWLRVLGLAIPDLPGILSPEQRSLRWSSLVADDVVGGFFSLNGGAFGQDLGSMYYWAPDTLNWEPLGLSYSDFLVWALSDNLSQFYQHLRWRIRKRKCERRPATSASTSTPCGPQRDRHTQVTASGSTSLSSSPSTRT